VTPRHEATVRARLADIAARAGEVAARFHENLVTCHSEVIVLLDGPDASAFQRQVAQTLAAIVEAAEEPEQLVALCAALGRRLGERGVREQHYARGAEALAEAVRETLGGGFNREAEEEFRIVLGVVQAVMQRANFIT
jgi:hemoglobin-like flavoprotein